MEGGQCLFLAGWAHPLILVKNDTIICFVSLAFFTGNLSRNGGGKMFNRSISKGEITLLSLLSVALTVPFIFYAKDIAKSMRSIAGDGVPARPPFYKRFTR